MKPTYVLDSVQLSGRERGRERELEEGSCVHLDVLPAGELSVGRQDGAQGLGQAERRGLRGRRGCLLAGQGQLLTRRRVRALCYLHLIKVRLQLRLFLEKESLLLESMFLQLLFEAPWWFFTIKLTGVLGF